MDILFLQGKIYKQYKNTKYYCDENGNIYSDFSHKILKPSLRGVKDKQYQSIDINFGNGQKHCYIHKIVYETWVGNIPKDMCVLHKDDNQFNNNFNNLYLGDFKDNANDRITNNHNIANIWSLTIYDKKINQTITFIPAYKFIEYSGHSCKNGCVNRMFTRHWFKHRYEIVDYYHCKNKTQKGVTTMGDECNPVE